MAHPSARALALAALREWRKSQRFADAILHARLATCALQGSDRAFVTELFYGILRNLTLLDFWIDLLRNGSLDHDLRDLLRLGLYQLFFLKTAEHAAVHESVALAAPRRRPIINAVLRAALRRKSELQSKAAEEALDIRMSHPRFLLERWSGRFGAEACAALCEWNNQPAPVYARINRLRIKPEQFMQKYAEAETLPSNPDFVKWRTVALEALAQGHCYVQDPSTALAGKMLDPQPGEKMLDACAAPGGKSAQIAELMANRGCLVACDREPRRIIRLRQNLEKLGVQAEIIHHDWTVRDEASPVARHAPFDRIMVDAPCSNTGVMRRRVDLRWRLTPRDFIRMPQEQFTILRASADLLKPGGVLVYSTCSIEREENEGVVARLFLECPFLQMTEQQTLLPFRDGFDGAFVAKFVRGLS